MSGVDWSRVREVFERALDAPPAQRRSVVQEACAGDEALRAEVESLLRADAVATGFMDRPLVESAADSGSHAGRRFGPYELDEQIGIGGMGVVYRAHRADGAYEQEVVVKLLRGHALDGELHWRFERERQLLASLRHPNIARLLDGGVGEGGQPFLVMEFVRGEDILTHCSRGALGLAERLELFDAVCAGVQHAHRNLVVHRDLKPAHAVIDEDGQPKLLDFGIATILREETSDRFATLTAENRLTPQYASPEQVRGEAVTTATDVYALGLILYELLAGEPPYRVQSGTTDADRRLICETSPLPPSRSVRDVRLSRRLRGDLDTIVLTAIRKEPDRRYASAEALREDLRRYREGRPIASRPDTLAYRTMKFVARNRVTVGAAVVIAFALVAATVVSTKYALETARQIRIANAVAGFLRDDVLGYADPHVETDRDIKLRTVLDRAAGSIDDRFKDEPLVSAALRSTLGAAYLGLGEAEAALRHHEAALAIRRAELGESHPETIRAQSSVVGALIESGEFKRAGEIVPGLLAAARRRLGRADPVTLTTLKHEALVFDGLGEYEAAVESMQRAVAAHEQTLGSNDPATLTARNDYALMLVDAGRYEDAEPIVRSVLATRRATLGPEHPDTLLSIASLGYLLGERGREREAEAALLEAVEIARRTLGDDHPRTAAYLYLLASSLRAQERLEEAERVAAEALIIRRARLGEDHPETMMSLALEGSLLQDLGRYEEAHDALVERHALGVRAQGRAHPSTLIAANNIANLLLAMGAPSEAEPIARETVELAARELPEDYWLIGAFQTNLGRALAELGRTEEARAVLEEALTLLAWTLGEDHARVERVRVLLDGLEKGAAPAGG